MSESVPGQSGVVARTEWGSFPGRGWEQPPPGSSPSAAPDPKTKRRTAGSDPTHHRKTWRCELFQTSPGNKTKTNQKKE